MRSSLFGNVKKGVSVITDVSDNLLVPFSRVKCSRKNARKIYLGTRTEVSPAFFFDCFTFENGTDMLSRNVGKPVPIYVGLHPRKAKTFIVFLLLSFRVEHSKHNNVCHCNSQVACIKISI
jgi:hypothetical protein